ncbi:exodeoxyribonuclease V subunit beta [Pseudomonas chlororaphis]|uniref:exodeoxyribonuclease V subunit beta n=1 Tax=Pseudomonas chlororaphis TaxID=587753 RepID=UPI0006A5DB64|nr:exodeoxyribonuclease V subunit beta [Pseudomonas chlororaphis]AZC99967.1 Exodeoxyribonuclease V beta chain [Pseudomonas chlororaphis subsp. chlororaphis]MBM0282049.1 exodeoxyribonuclease V subunit beta [Pseudomonas chlororaphis]MDO1504442.1 exodeoxyribonuclease V subunit beta [Pseudomonas chlororaphis]ORM49483.1 exodeoxyribonuclease V subunit beta [Pseudomonas chlororaphis subsp. chlororaphis]TWR94416.1 exodeoxyribonuclease V subunit beta [Pseudomonas chlororaphis subsp. chlororaphis]
MTRQAPLALAFPLRGSQLIEASAGTGKTFTISALYLRLVLGHGGEPAGFGRELLPPQILVVTFTDAATKELRERIRTRLAEAARFFRDETAAPDALIAELRDQFAAEQWPGCASRLDIAAQWMDEAAVSTIHSWCQRMLREHAFDSGSLFTQTLETDHSDLLGEVLRDYWRLFCYPMQGDALNWVRANWGGPAALLPRVRALFGSEREVDQEQTPAQLIESCLLERRAALVQLKAPWRQWAEQLREICLQGVASKAVDGRKMQARYFEAWFEKITAWAEDESIEQLDIGTGFSRLTPEGMAEAWKGDAPDHPALDAMAGLKAALDALPSPDAAVLQHAARWVGARFEEEKRRRAEMGFDDMLLRLDAALQAEGGERLATLIREQFPVALIDEFQDTDPVQYRIFESIYRIEDNNPETGLFLIGDPKQAIYAFRGADIYTYLRARQATSGRLHTLGTNFRSSHAMVKAVNHVFERAESREQGRGAFLFREKNGENPVPFLSVASQGRKEQLHREGQVVPALNIWHLSSEQAISGALYRQQLAAACASEIVALLNGGQQASAGFARDGQPFKGLLPADIAILVRDGKEAQAVRGELAARGVRSVYLSDKDSVFAAQEAHDLLAWLKACAEPDIERPLRAALASITLNLPLVELERLNQDELAWESRVMQFRGYRLIWRTQGVLPMLRRLLHDFQLPQALIARSDGERVLTNLLHLSELLQQAAAELDGEQALIRHLAEHLALSGQAGEEQILRLESDEQLVKVVTIHKSKGLEYPLVFLPFICSAKPVDGSRLPLHYHDESGKAQVTLRPTPELIAQADDERLAEDLRLLYVALTRAQHACWLGVADLKRGNHNSSVLHLSALGYLLGGGALLNESSGLARWLQDLQQGCEAMSVSEMPSVSDSRFHPPRNDATLLAPLAPKRRAAENWWIASYSALRISDSLGAGSTEAPESPQAQKLFDDERLDPDAPREVVASGADIHRFPRGPNPGTFLHGLLEWAGDEGFAADPVAIEDAIARRCNRRGWQGWIKTLSDWLRHLLQLPLPAGAGRSPVVLAQLSQYRVEMEFWFASHKVDVLKLDELVRQYTHQGVPRVTAEPVLLNGMFKGFIDLTFEHQGRYYVADYKSNWLGVDDAAYTEQAMEQSILDNRYDLQYVLYLLALHRQLRARLADYDYDRHMGGALYLFLRGTGSASRGVFFTRPPRELIERLDRLFQGKPEQPRAEPAWEQGVLL